MVRRTVPDVLQRFVDVEVGRHRVRRYRCGGDRRQAQQVQAGSLLGRLQSRSEVRETKLPGVGVRHEFTTQVGRDVGVIVHHDGRREILVYDEADPDKCSSIMRLSGSDTQTLAELLGASHVTETVAAVQQEIEGLGIEWVDLPADSPAIGTTIGEGEFRTKTGASIVAAMRDGTSVPAPGPDFSFRAGDVVAAVGTLEGLASLRLLLSP